MAPGRSGPQRDHLLRRRDRSGGRNPRGRHRARFHHRHRPRLGGLLRRRYLRQPRLGRGRRPGTDRTHGLVRFSPDLEIDWRFPFHEDNLWGAISDCYALNVYANTAWTCHYTGFPVVRVHIGVLAGWRGDNTAAKAPITDGSRIALYGGYSADRDRLVVGQLSDSRCGVAGNIGSSLRAWRNPRLRACHWTRPRPAHPYRRVLVPARPQRRPS